jgi:hypothetical protein
MLGDLPRAMALIDAAVASAERAGDARTSPPCAPGAASCGWPAGTTAAPGPTSPPPSRRTRASGERWLLVARLSGNGGARARARRPGAGRSPGRGRAPRRRATRTTPGSSRAALDTLAAALVAVAPNAASPVAPAPSGPRSPPPCSAPPPARAGARACGSASTTSRRRRGPWPRRASPSGPRRSTPPGRRARRSPRRRWWPTRPPSARPARPRPRGRAARGGGAIRARVHRARRRAGRRGARRRSHRRRATPPGPAPAAGAAALQVLCFGPMTVARAGVALGPAELTPAKARELLLYLVLNPPRTKEQIALALWPTRARRACATRSTSRSTTSGASSAARRRWRSTAPRTGSRAAAPGATPRRSTATWTRWRRPPTGRGAPTATPSSAACAAATRSPRPARAPRPSRRGARRSTGRGAARSARGPTPPTGCSRTTTGCGRCGATGWRRWPACTRAAAPRRGRRRARGAGGVRPAARGRAPGAHGLLRRGGEPARALAHHDALAALLAREVGAAPARETRALADAIRRGG